LQIKKQTDALDLKKKGKVGCNHAATEVGIRTAHRAERAIAGSL
jgi:hypothetical protein